MLKDECSIIVKRPLDEVFKFVATDYFQNRSKWTPGVVKLEKTSIGPLRVGTTGREIRRSGGGKLSETELVVTQYEPNSRFTVKASAVFVQSASAAGLEAKRKSRSSQAEGTYTFQS